MRLLLKLLKALNSDASPWQLAFGLTFGMIVGLTPILRLHNLVILLLVLCFRVNISGFLLALAFFSGVAWITDPLVLGWGESVLTAASLQDIWTALYNTDLGRISQFNHTLTMGSLLLGLLLSPIMLFVSRWLIVKYRERFMAWVTKLKIIQFLKGSKLYQLYQQLQE